MQNQIRVEFEELRSNGCRRLTLTQLFKFSTWQVSDNIHKLCIKHNVKLLNTKNFESSLLVTFSPGVSTEISFKAEPLGCTSTMEYWLLKSTLIATGQSCCKPVIFKLSQGK